MDHLRLPEPFSFEGPNVAQRWTRWRKQFQTYFTACEYGKKSKDVQVAVLLHSAGQEAQDIHEHFQFDEETAEADRKNYTKILDKFGDYCRPRKNVVYERYRFWSRDQIQDEHVDNWVKDLRTIAVDCEFGEQEDLMIRDKLVFGICDTRVKERMLRESDLTLQKALDIVRAAESTKAQMKEMSKESASNHIDQIKTSGTGTTKESVDKRTCYKCGEVGHISPNCNNLPMGEVNRNRKRLEGSENRPTCYNCGGVGHLSRNCANGDDYPQNRRKTRGRGRQTRGRGRTVIHDVEEDDGFGDYMQEFQSLSLNAIRVNMVGAAAGGQKTKRYAKFRFHRPDSRTVKEEKLKIDTGAEANLMPLKIYQSLYPEYLQENGMPMKRYIEKSPAVLEAYGGSVINQIGRVHLPCEYNGKKFTCPFYLSNVDGPILLGYPTGESLGIVKILVIDDVTSPKAYGEDDRYISPGMAFDKRPPIKNKDDLRSMYPECFDNSDKHFLDFEYEIKVDDNVKPCIHAQRRMPIEPRVRRKLDAMVRDNVIVKVDEPTEWVNSMLVETKDDGRLRICLDPVDLNKAIKREHYPMPVLDDIVPELAGSDLFTKLDAKDGYWHVKLDKKSSLLTTFNTPFGRYRYLRMPFGLKMSQDVFQKKIDEVYSPCTGAIGIADDLTVHGKGDNEHDMRLHQVMERTRQANIGLNYDKISVKQPSVKFFGNIYSAKGINADPDKIAAITALRHPESREELRTFLGMVNYLQQFIPKLSEATEPLRAMDRDGVVFKWDATYQVVFDEIKSLVAKDISLAYYDRTKPVTLQTDYSKKGLGAVLVQEGRPVRYASKAVTVPEANFAPIEGEMLAVFYGIMKFHHYLYGRGFTVNSDHKPLHHIHKKNLSLAPPRLRDMLMKLSPYDFEIEYKPGEEMVLPDTFSRLSQADHGEIRGLKVRIHNLVDISCSRLAQLKHETENDSVLQKLLVVFNNGWPSTIKSLDEELRPYWAIRDDISVIDGLMMAGSRIIIPEKSRQRVLASIHEGHQGEVKCLLRAKESVYWPGLYKEIEQIVKSCAVCQEFENALPKCPMLGIEVPDQPWHTLGADLFYFNGKWNILLTDYYSKAPFVRYVSSTGAHASIKAMKSIFAENGIPCKIVSDNGPHFSAYAFDAFAKHWGFELILSSPEYPRGHAFVERQVQTIKKCMRKCDAGGYDFDLAMLALRATPLDSHLPSPAELLNGRKLRTRVPTVIHKPKDSSFIKKRLVEKQKIAAEIYDRTAVSKTDLNEGQNVRVYNKDRKAWEPATVLQKAQTPRSYVIQREMGGIPLRRNRQHLKPTVEVWNSRDSANRSPQDESSKPSSEVHAGNQVVNVDTDADIQLSSRPIRCRKQTTFYQAS